jgi:DNA-directed RNA polymerase specialized sigma24 family protein
MIALDPEAALGRHGDERALVRAAQRGSADAVEALVRSNWDRAHRTAFLIVHDAVAAEDICQEAMLSALGALDPETRAIVVLRHLLEYSSNEIGAMLGLPPATVRTRLRRALAELRAVLEDDGGPA